MLCYSPILAEIQDVSLVENMLLMFNCYLILKSPETSKSLSVRESLVRLLAMCMTGGCQRLGPCLKENSFLTL